MSEPEMPRETYQMLERFYDAGEEGILALTINNTVESKDRISQLQGLGFIGVLHRRPNGKDTGQTMMHYQIKTKGRDFINETRRREDAAAKQQQAEQEQRLADQTQRIRDRKQQYHHDWLLAIFSAFAGAIVGAGVTLFIEHVLL